MKIEKTEENIFQKKKTSEKKNKIREKEKKEK